MFIQLRVPIAKTNWIDREKKELWRQNWAIDITEISLVRTKKNMLLLKKDTFCTAIKKIDKKKLSSSQKYWVSLGVIDMGFNGFSIPRRVFL